MTLPFRRRHHDDDTAHDRARALTSNEMLEPLREDESAWLARHLEACTDCRRDRDAYLADRELLRSLRDRAPEPPRDLWARTAAAFDRESGHRPRARSDAGRRGGPGWRGLPLGAAAGTLILLVVIGTSFIPGPQRPTSTPVGSQIAVIPPTPVLGPTPITIDSSPIGFVRTAPDGSVELVFGDVDEVCPASDPQCGPSIDEGPARPVKIAARPSTMTISPNADQLVVEPAGETGSTGRILVVPVPAASPPATPVPSTVPETIGPATEEPSLLPASPETTPEPTPEPTPGPTPTGQIEIASGVTIVGDIAYSEDGTWLAFSARPFDGSTGPDLYLWSVGSPMATVVTTDHQTYFSAWLGNQVLASRIEVPAEPTPSGGPVETAEPAATDGTESPSGGPDSSPGSSEAPVIEPVVGHPASFLLDPATLASIDLQQPDVWLPVVDPNGRFATYWSGTLHSIDGLEWALGTGQLVLDGWASGSDAPTDPLATPGATPDPVPSAEPSESAAPAVGPKGAGMPVVAGSTGAFNTRFDPDGTRLAIWVTEQVDEAIGRLHLLVLDAETGVIDPAQTPLPGVPALDGFSIDEGRLAWVSPPGQDGKQSAVKVLGWSDSEFGEIQTRAATDLYIVR